MTEEIGLDLISEVTDKNYSVGKIEDSTNNNQTCDKNSIVSAESFDKKFSSEI